MNRREFVVSTFAGVLGVSEVSRVAGQAKTITPDLVALADRNSLTLFNRGASRLVDGARKGVRLSEAPGEGVAFLPGIEFATGTIEFDIRGRDVAQQSFVGVAFHGVDAAAYDAIYFRPFNFRARDPVSRSHAVQYHSLPVYTWQKLRTDQLQVTFSPRSGVRPLHTALFSGHVHTSVTGSRRSSRVTVDPPPSCERGVLYRTSHEWGLPIR
jgi:hypothetical protein